MIDRPPRQNALGQPIGWPVEGDFPRPRPARAAMQGRICCLEPANPAEHAEPLYLAFSEDSEDRTWTYMHCGPFASAEALARWMAATCLGDDPLFFVIRDVASDRCLGFASFLRINPEAGSIEAGSIALAPALQRTPAATEALYLMMSHAMDDLGYRRFEWKCDALNARSRSAAERLGFHYEGTFRQATHYKGRNRDTAWYAFTDGDWPQISTALRTWLDPANFDPAGAQIRGLAELRAGIEPDS